MIKVRICPNCFHTPGLEISPGVFIAKTIIRGGDGYDDAGGDWVCPDGVRMEDFAFLAGHWMETTSEADLSGDGVVDMADLVMFGEHWMAGI
jgi:hypothetical protein